VVSSLENHHFIFCLAYLADIFEQLNKVNLTLQRMGRTIIDLIDALSAFADKLDKWKRKAQAGNFSMFESLATATGDEVNADIASEVIQHLGGQREEVVLYFLEIIETNLDLTKNHFVFPLENVADCIKDELIKVRY